jgi:NAD+ diphosphatase
MDKAMRYCPQCGHKLAPATVDGTERLKCTSKSCDFVHWDNPTPVVGAIVELDGAVVLARKEGWPEKMFGLITGFLEKGETPEASILREVREELGLEGEIVDFVGYYAFFEMNQLILVFHVKAQGDIQLSEELSEIKHIHPDRLRPWPIGTGPAVRDWLERRKACHPQ